MILLLMNLGFAAGTPVIPPPTPQGGGDGGRNTERHHYESEEQKRQKELRKRIEEQTKEWEIYMRVYTEYRKLN